MYVPFRSRDITVPPPLLVCWLQVCARVNRTDNTFRNWCINVGRKNTHWMQKYTFARARNAVSIEPNIHRKNRFRRPSPYACAVSVNELFIRHVYFLNIWWKEPETHRVCCFRLDLVGPLRPCMNCTVNLILSSLKTAKRVKSKFFNTIYITVPYTRIVFRFDSCASTLGYDIRTWQNIYNSFSQPSRSSCEFMYWVTLRCQVHGNKKKV